MKTIVLLLLIGHLLTVQAIAVKKITDANFPKGTSVTLSADTAYILHGIVTIDSGSVLTIQPGTFILADTIYNDTAAALVISRNAKIIAKGTKEKPIIFTTIYDNPTIHNETFDKDSIWTRSKWAGLSVLGNAKVATASGTGIMRGYTEAKNPEMVYGNSIAKNDDSSGVLSYISIRYGGASFSSGLFLGGVGKKTVVSHIEVFGNAYHSIEISGGSVNCKYLSVAIGASNDFHIVNGWSGAGQFWSALRKKNPLLNGDYTYENGDCLYLDSKEVRSTLANLTICGESTDAFAIDTFTRINLFSSIFQNFYVGIKFTKTDSISVTKSFSMNKLKYLTFADIGSDGPTSKNLWYHAVSRRSVINSPFLDTNILISNGFIKGRAPILYAPDYLLPNWDRGTIIPMVDLRPKSNGGIDTQITTRCDKWKDLVNEYKNIDSTFLEVKPFNGAFDPTKPHWVAGWTALSQYGFLDTASKVDLPLSYPTNFNLSILCPTTKNSKPLNSKQKASFVKLVNGVIQLSEVNSSNSYKICSLLGKEITPKFNLFQNGNLMIGLPSNISKGIYYIRCKDNKNEVYQFIITK